MISSRGAGLRAALASPKNMRVRALSPLKKEHLETRNEPEIQPPLFFLQAFGL